LDRQTHLLDSKRRDARLLLSCSDLDFPPHHMNPEALIATYEAREPLYTEGDFTRRFAGIKNARAIGISGNSADKAPDDRMIALLASGRVSNAEYFRLAAILGVDSAGLIYSEPSVERVFTKQLRATWRALAHFLAGLRRE
jgi:hypothetical protein